MAQKQDNKPGENAESEVWGAIAAFEQILEALPNDRTSIETLAHAYEQIGDLSRAKDYTLRLADLVLSEADVEAATGILPKVEAFSASDPAAATLLERLRRFVTSAGVLSKPVPADERTPAAGSEPVAPPAASIPVTFNVATELPLAWNLLQAGEITQEEYSSVVQDLTEMSSNDRMVTVSMLHVLNDRGFKNLPKILAAIAKDCGTPILALSGFEPQPNAFNLLPMELMVRRGVIVFDLFGQDGLAVIMNPYDKELIRTVETVARRKCFFYLTMPTDFDAAIAKIGAWYEQQEAAKTL